jgi:hypothetical protein
MKIDIFIVFCILFIAVFGVSEETHQLHSKNIKMILVEKRGIANASFLTAFDLSIGLGSIFLGIASISPCELPTFISGLIFVFFVNQVIKQPISFPQKNG